MCGPVIVTFTLSGSLVYLETNWNSSTNPRSPYSIFPVATAAGWNTPSSLGVIGLGCVTIPYSAVGSFSNPGIFCQKKLSIAFGGRDDYSGDGASRRR